MALLSALAVYKDLAPGYRIRQLTEKEEGEKVRDEVKRLREGEKMLVRSYKGYLKLMETEIKSMFRDVQSSEPRKGASAMRGRMLNGKSGLG